MSRRGLAACLRAAAVAAALLAAALAGAAEDGPADEDDDEEPAAAAVIEPAASAPAGPVAPDSGVTALPAAPAGAYRLEVRAPGPLRALLVRHLDLARFREQPDISRTELGRLLAATPAQARSLLEPEGYFDARVEVQRVEAADGAAALVTVDVQPGVQARVGRVQLEMQGPMADAIERGNLAQRKRWRRLQALWSLPTGAPFTSAAWERAKATLLANLQSRGFATASFSGTGAEVDAEQATVRLFVVVDSGPTYRIGEVRIDGLQRTPVSAAENVRPFALGATYTEKRLLDYQEALQKTGLYEGVAVELDADPEHAARATVNVRLREQRPQSATVSVGFSSNTGPRAGLEHTHRRIFDRDLVAVSKLKLGRDERVLSLDLLTYPQPGNRRTLLGVQADYLNAGGALTQTQRLRFGRSQSSEKLDRLYYLELNRTTLDTALTRSADRAVLGNYEWVKRDVNSVVFPTSGLTLSLQSGAGYADDSDGDLGPFARLYLQAVWYQPLGAGWFAQLRGEAAQVLKRDTLGVPDSLLFRAGGDNSVRGYGYRTLGPLRDGSVVGGPVLATGSVELMRRLSNNDRWRDWFGAVFVDAGNAALDWPSYSPVVGYGVGLRWRSPIGPLRSDIAYGQDIGQWRLHLSVGITY
ncbi:MAG TPA: BamA/TamA family outer membrane protein [Methylibium sp.]|nr:BamA/TamA family outer membrane protein [Methylibium sp.]